MPVNYNTIAPNYHQRYIANALDGVATQLHRVAREINATRLLDVGTGTGRWLKELRSEMTFSAGVDYSLGMLTQGRGSEPGDSSPLVNADACVLPFADASFDLLVSVNAIHHFPNKPQFIREARRVLRPGGAYANVVMDPHSARNVWSLYDFFDTVLELDLRRFPSSGQIVDWLIQAGFSRVEWRIADHIQDAVKGRAILDDHFFQKYGSSQLAQLSDEAYAAGVAKTTAAIEAAEARGETLVFRSDVDMVMTVGFVE